MTPGPIPWTAIDRYAMRYGMDEDEFDFFKHVMMRVDSRWLLHVRSKGESGPTVEEDDDD
jgi:hypothetical protein